MRICKPNELSSILGMGNPSYGNFGNYGFAPAQTASSGGNLGLETIAQIAPSTPVVGSVGPITPTDPYSSPPSVSAPQTGLGGYVPGSVVPGSDPQLGPGLNMCPNLGPGPSGFSSEAPGNPGDFGLSADDGGYGGNSDNFA